MVSNFELIALTISFIWSIVLTVLFWKLYSHYTNLVRDASKKTLKSILDDLLAQVDLAKKDISSINLQIDRLEKKEPLHLQKVGLIRFNPFKDTGGDQSFVLALVDSNDTGIVISGLYARSGTRWYAKRVEKGKGVEHDLSDEEKKAIKEARTTG